MRPRRRRPAENLDSLLDTMANVVGILVVLMAVMQITVGDAMDRIRDIEIRSVQLAPEEAQRARDLASRLEALEQRWRDEVEGDAPPEQEIARLDAEIDALRAESQVAASARADRDRLQTTLAERRATLRRLEDEVETSGQQLASLRLRVGDSPARAADAGRVARLPDPRPALPDTEAVGVFCRYGRCFEVDFEFLSARLSREVGRVLGADPRTTSIGFDEMVQLANHFEVTDVGSDTLRWRLKHRAGNQLHGLLRWRSRDAGETLDELRAGDSSYRALVGSLDPNRHYLFYRVWGDSFDVYLEARRIAEEAGLAAGWVPMDSSEEFERDLLSRPHLDPVPLD